MTGARTVTAASPQGHEISLDESAEDTGLSALEIITILVERWRLLLIGPVAAGGIALGVSFLIPPTFTARTSFLPPQQQQSAAASALASLGALSGLAGGMAGIKTPGDQYVALMQSVNVEDRLVDRFKLMDLYGAKYRFQARAQLEQNVHIAVGKKDGLITVEADAKDPTMAADLANQYVSELRRLSAELVLTEAQQRRAFFAAELKRTGAKLTDAQQSLQRSGFNPGAMKAEPKAAADSYAKIQAEVTAAEVRLQTMRQSLADSAPEVQQQAAQLSALRTQLLKLEGTASTLGDADYIGRYREFKYQETLFDLLSKQYEMARLDESREGALIQVVDTATVPEYKSKPKRLFVGLTAAFGTFLLLAIGVLARHFWQAAKADPNNTEKFARLNRAWSGR
jgi:uncharacterized protein involved in exopolysaccharide biosynthesis